MSFDHLNIGDEVGIVPARVSQYNPYQCGKVIKKTATQVSVATENAVYRYTLYRPRRRHMGFDRWRI